MSEILRFCSKKVRIAIATMVILCLFFLNQPNWVIIIVAGCFTLIFHSHEQDLLKMEKKYDELISSKEINTLNEITLKEKKILEYSEMLIESENRLKQERNKFCSDLTMFNKKLMFLIDTITEFMISVPENEYYSKYSPIITVLMFLKSINSYSDLSNNRTTLMHILVSNFNEILTNKISRVELYTTYSSIVVFLTYLHPLKLSKNQHYGNGSMSSITTCDIKLLDTFEVIAKAIYKRKWINKESLFGKIVEYTNRTEYYNSLYARELKLAPEIFGCFMIEKQCDNYTVIICENATLQPIGHDLHYLIDHTKFNIQMQNIFKKRLDDYKLKDLEAFETEVVNNILHINIFLKIIKKMKIMYFKGFFHWDFSLENLLIYNSHPFDVVLCDFGFCTHTQMFDNLEHGKMLGLSPEMELLKQCLMNSDQFLGLLGMKPYMHDPEIIVHKKNLALLHDTYFYGKVLAWQFGIIIYSLEIGYPPFYINDNSSKGRNKVIEQIMNYKEKCGRVGGSSMLWDGKKQYCSQFIKELLEKLLEPDNTQRMDIFSAEIALSVQLSKMRSIAINENGIDIGIIEKLTRVFNIEWK